MTLCEAAMQGRRLAADSIMDDVVTRRVIELLRPGERELLSVWAGGQVSNRALAAVMGCHPGTMVRRIRRLRERLRHPVSRAVAIRGRELSNTRRQVAIRVFVYGEPTGHVARQLELTRGEMSRMLGEIRGWADARQ